MSKISYLIALGSFYLNPNNAAPQRKPPKPRLLRIDPNGQVVRLPPNSSEIRMQSGYAWVSAAGRDYVVGPGERLSLPIDKNPMLISAVHGQAAVMEVEAAAPWGPTYARNQF